MAAIDERAIELLVFGLDLRLSVAADQGYLPGLLLLDFCQVHVVVLIVPLLLLNSAVLAQIVCCGAWSIVKVAGLHELLIDFFESYPVRCRQGVVHELCGLEFDRPFEAGVRKGVALRRLRVDPLRLLDAVLGDLVLSVHHAARLLRHFLARLSAVYLVLVANDVELLIRERHRLILESRRRHLLRLRLDGVNHLLTCFLFFVFDRCILVHEQYDLLAFVDAKFDFLFLFVRWEVPRILLFLIVVHLDSSGI